MTWLIVVLGLLACWFAIDRLQTTHPVFRVYPIAGRVAAWLRISKPGSDGGRAPFTPSEMRAIRERALTGSSLASFGGEYLTAGEGQVAADVAVLPVAPQERFRVSVGESVDIPLLNFGALGLGPASVNAIRAIGLASRRVDCLQNTGEDGLTAVHRDGGARLVWQIGTGYWGCRRPDGSFDSEAFVRTASEPQVELIELKLSQGAKPGAGGFLPAVKNTRRMASLLGVPANTDVVSPQLHTAFASVEEMLAFVQTLTELSGKPVGVKVCVGSERSASDLVLGIGQMGATPAFVNVDAGAGGSGAAPYELMNYAGLPAHQGVAILDRMLIEAGLRNDVRLFASGGVRSGFDLFHALCLGADGCFFTRAPMVAMGCVQARRCHTGACPSGVATQQWWRRGAISPDAQGRQLAAYYDTVRAGYVALLTASARRGSTELDPSALATCFAPAVLATAETQRV